MRKSREWRAAMRIFGPIAADRGVLWMDAAIEAAGAATLFDMTAADLRAAVGDEDRLAVRAGQIRDLLARCRRIETAYADAKADAERQGLSRWFARWAREAGPAEA